MPCALGMLMSYSKIAFLFMLSFGTTCCFAQNNSSSKRNVKPSDSIAKVETHSKNEVIIGYKVEERVATTYGSSVTTYRVGSLDLINQNDLGPNNKRTITPIYGKGKSVVVAVTNPVSAIKVTGNTDVSIPKPVLVVIPKNQGKSIKKEKKPKIDVVGTYERVLNNGYKSVDMLKKVADKSFFDGDLEASAKWYSQLFELTTELDPVYYYRYAESLKAIHETEKAQKMMELFQAKKV